MVVNAEQPKKTKGKIGPQKYVFNAYIKKKKRQPIPSEIRLSGVSPIMPIKHQKPKKNQGQNRPSEIRFAGVPHIMPIKTQKT